MSSITNARAIAILDAIRTACDAGAGPAVIRVYDGTPPPTLDTTLGANTQLAELVMGDPSWQAPVDLSPGARMTANAITDDAAADATGTPTFVRVFDSNLNPVVQMSAGVGSGEVDFLAGITVGLPVRITAMTLDMAEA